MATLRVSDGELVLGLTVGERLAGLLRDVRVPLRDVSAVDVVDDPIRAVRGLRAPGLGLPRARIGTWRRRDGRTVAVARGGRPAVRVRIAPREGDRRPLRELVVSVADARAVAAAIVSALPANRPAGD